MALSIVSPSASFVQFSETGRITHCIFDNLNFCLPAYEDDDINFQFYIQGTQEEIDELCGAYGIPVQVGIVEDCDDEDFLLEFTANLYQDYTPEMFRLSETLMLVNWSHGLPGFTGVITPNECFNIRVQIGDLKACSNCIERISDPCFTSVVEYANEENAFGFNYCNSGETVGPGDSSTCEKTVITFTNKATLTIPYTTSMLNAYGSAPTIQVWIYNESSELVNMGTQAVLDNYPPNNLIFDFGGLASGIIVIR